MKNNTVRDIAIFGDPTILPTDKLRKLERRLRGVWLERHALGRVIEDFYEQHGIRSGRASIRDLLETIPT